MPQNIPYTFTPGTKAKANEVNADFQAVKAFVDDLEVISNNNTTNITNLQNNKADLNGNISEIFNVADPVTAYNAVNLQTFNKYTSNTKAWISGFELSIYDVHTVYASAGSAWDSTYEHVLMSDTALMVTQTNLGNNATYYIYVVGNDDDEVQLIFDLSDTNPNLPVGYTYFRRLGNVTTNGSGEIVSVSSESNDASSNKPQAILPNYSNRVMQSVGTTYTAPTDGLLIVGHQNGYTNDQRYLYFNCSGLSVPMARMSNGTGFFQSTTTYPLSKGDTYSITGATSSGIWFVNARGGN